MIFFLQKMRISLHKEIHISNGIFFSLIRHLITFYLNHMLARPFIPQPNTFLQIRNLNFHFYICNHFDQCPSDELALFETLVCVSVLFGVVSALKELSCSLEIVQVLSAGHLCAQTVLDLFGFLVEFS